MRANLTVFILCAYSTVLAITSGVGSLASAGEVVQPFPAKASPNAAVIYWQAFAAMPKLTESDSKRINDAAADSAKMSKELPSLVIQYDVALAQLHRAAKEPACDWNLDYSLGPALLLPHVAKARELSRVALLRARLRFKANETTAALTDVWATMKLARDVGQSPLLISLLVDTSIEASANEVLALYLPKLKGEELDALAKQIAELPAPPTVADCLALEGKVFVDWFEQRVKAEIGTSQDPKNGGKTLRSVLKAIGSSSDDKAAQAAIDSLSVADVKAAIAKTKADYRELTRIAALGLNERREQGNRFLAEIAKAKAMKTPADRDRLLSAAIIPAVTAVMERETQRDTRRSLLAMAIQVQKHGQDALKSSRRPGEGPIEFRKTKAGFELRYHYTPTDKWEVLRVGSTSQ